MEMSDLLFPEMKDALAQPEPRGFRYRDHFVSEEEQAALAERLEELALKPFEFHGYLGNRRTMSFGLKYDYNQGRVELAEAVPEFLHDLQARVAAFAGCSAEAIRQVGVNEYRPGAGIGWHRDKPQFGIVIGVSLLAPATMRFRRARGKGQWARISHGVRPRSIYVLSGEARTLWEHSIPPLPSLRYSLTFRTLATGSALSHQPIP